jgi:hypothetical protein
VEAEGFQHFMDIVQEARHSQLPYLTASCRVAASPYPRTICFDRRRSRRPTKQANSIETTTANDRPATLNRDTPTGFKSIIGADFIGAVSAGSVSTGVGSIGATSTGSEGVAASACDKRSLPLR